MIEQFAEHIPPELKDKSGAVFYSGRDAFTGSRDVYVLGLNPGGNPVERPDETIGWHTDVVLHNKPDRWSEYTCESWLARGRYYKPGEGGIQPSVIELIQKLGYDPREVPASNVVFTRSKDEVSLQEKDLIANACWQFHREVIAHLEPKLILCMGRGAEDILKNKTNAVRKGSSMSRRHGGGGYLVEVFRNQRGCILVSVAHPGRIKWSKAEIADISGVVGKTLSGTVVRWSSIDVC